MSSLRVLALAALCLTPVTAHAFGNCTAPGYLAAFGETGGAEPCDLRHEQHLSVNGHPFDLRVISRASVPHDGDEVWIARITETVNRLARAAEAMGPSLRVPDITVLLTDRTHADGDLEIHGERTTVRIPGECPIAFYKTEDAVTNTDFAFTFAHETFHCIQDVTWPGQSATSAADWWAEGSAEYFAQMVVPEAAPLTSRFVQYANRSMDSPPYLEGHDYENVLFFDGLHDSMGPEGVAGFMAAMPPDGGFLAALQGQISLDDWADFVETYLLGLLPEPAAGRSVPAPRVQLEHIVEEDERSIELSTDAFEIFRLDVVFPAGSRYEVSIEGSADLRSKISTGDDLWLDFPVQVMACGAATRTTIYAVTTTGPQDFTLHYTRLGECGDCQDISTRDACVAGRWTMTGGGPVEYMRAMGMPANIRAQVSEISLRFLRGGDYVVNPIDAEVEGNSDGLIITGDATNRDSAGRWSTADGQLFICPLAGEVVATTRIEAMQNTMTFGPGENIAIGYTCAGNTLQTTITIPGGLPPMETTYTRQGR